MADHKHQSNPADEAIDLYLGLSYRTSTSSGEREESGDYIIEMKADILGEVDLKPGMPQTEIHLGFLKFSIIRVGGAINDGFPLDCLFDVSQEICDLACGLYENGFEEFKDPIRKEFPDASPWDDILYFQSLELQPFARGQRVGLSALHRAAKDWESGCGLVVIQPHPLQYPNGERNDDTWRRLGMDDSTPDFKTSKKKLENYYKQLGFEKAGRSNYMFRCPADPQIDVDVPHSILLPQSTIDAHARLSGNV
jgi:GNAT superfamily N-acetyltransferase